MAVLEKTVDAKALQKDLLTANQQCQRLVNTQENQEPLIDYNTPT